MKNIFQIEAAVLRIKQVIRAWNIETYISKGLRRPPLVNKSLRSMIIPGGDTPNCLLETNRP